ncbi:Copper uptake system-associated protein [Hyphomicrobium sp. 1Nfss2.1]
MQHRSLALPYVALALLGWMALSGAIHAVFAQSSHDEAAIRAITLAEWDKPDAKLSVAPIVIEGDYAVTGWVQGNRGGRALLHKSSGKWAVMLCSGDPLKHASVLVEAGIPADAAERLARNLAAEESRLPPDQVALFSTFEGLMKVNENESHAGHHNGGHH